MSPTRSQDVYFDNPAYLKPEVPPLPAPDDISSFEAIGVRQTPVARRILQAGWYLSGFTPFLKSLPGQIEHLLRTTNDRLPGLYAPVLAATIALLPDRRSLSPFQRAASLVMGARQLYEDWLSGRLPPDRLAGSTGVEAPMLEMGQYDNLFSTSQVIENGHVKLYKSDDFSSLAIVYRRRIFILRVWDGDQSLSVNQLSSALEQIVQSVDNQAPGNEPPPVGLLTAAADATQIQTFTQLRKDPVNCASLDNLKNTFLTLCLELDQQPASMTDVARLSHIGDPANRWWHASLQLVVFGNSQAAAICNFSAYLDGNPMMRAASEIYKKAAALPFDENYNHPITSTWSTLKWAISPAAIDRAQHDVERILDQQVATFELPGFGQSFFNTCQVAPIPGFVLALAMAAYQLTEKNMNINQFISMSRYRCTDLAIGVVSTPEVNRFAAAINSFQRNEPRASELLIMMDEAVESIQRVTHQVREHLSSYCLFGLYLGALPVLQRWLVSATMSVTLLLLHWLKLFTPQRTEILISHPSIYKETPIIGRPGIRMPNLLGFGLHYQIMDDKTVVTWMPAIAWQKTNQEMTAALQDSLQKIANLAGLRQPARSDQ